jgi:flavin-dependent dehydrogenase
VGGGPAGAALAIVLALHGRETLIVEKSDGPHDKMCGEFLSAEALAYLEDLGLDVFSLGAERIQSLRLAIGSCTVDASLPFRAASLSRKRLDEALLDRARALGVAVKRGRRVQAVENNRDHWETRLDSDETVQSRTVFLATGKHDLHGLVRQHASSNALVAFKMHWLLTAQQTEALRNTVELIFFSGGYAGLQLVENGVANLCLVIERRQLRRLSGKWDAVLDAILTGSPHLAVRLENAIPLWQKPLALSSIPYGYLRRRTEGIWYLGDQAAVIPSFTGDGMSLSLHSSLVAAELFLSGSSASEFQTRFAGEISRPLNLGVLFSRLLQRSSTRALIGRVVTAFPGILASAGTATRIPNRVRLSLNG